MTKRKRYQTNDGIASRKLGRAAVAALGGGGASGDGGGQLSRRPWPSSLLTISTSRSCAEFTAPDFIVAICSSREEHHVAELDVGGELLDPVEARCGSRGTRRSLTLFAGSRMKLMKS